MLSRVLAEEVSQVPVQLYSKGIRICGIPDRHKSDSPRDVLLEQGVRILYIKRGPSGENNPS